MTTEEAVWAVLFSGLFATAFIVGVVVGMPVLYEKVKGNVDPDQEVPSAPADLRSDPGDGVQGPVRDNCTMIPVYPVELERMEKSAGRPLAIAGEHPGIAGRGAVILEPNGTSCALLVAGRCSIHNDRPLICRLYGLAQGLECPHGCLAFKTLTMREGKDLQRRLEKI